MGIFKMIPEFENLQLIVKLGYARTWKKNCTFNIHLLYIEGISGF